MRRLVFLFVLLFSLPAFSQAKHPFTFEDMMKLKRVGEPVPSPDGKWVLFSAVDVDLAANTKTPHIWIVPLNTNNNGATGVSPVQQGSGGQERVLIADQDGDRPRWAPDGKRFAFLSNKDGGSQVWIADFDGAAGAVTGIHELTTIATEAGGELWSPDGKYILFTSDVYPECDGATKEEAACNANKVEAAGKSKVKALIFDRLLYRHWNAFKVGKRSHIFVVAAPPARHELPDSAAETQSTTTVALPRDLTPGDYDAPVFSLGGQDDYAFSPDGQEICYTSNHDKVAAASTNNDLWIVSVNAGTGGTFVAPRNITADNPASDSTPLYSPDGKYIAYRAQQRPGYESDRFRLMLYDRKTGEKKGLSEDFDGWVGTFAWSPFSTRIFFSSEDQGKSPIFSVLVPTGERIQQPLVVVATADDLVVTPNGQDVLFTSNSVQEPVAIYGSLLCPNGKDNPCGHLPPPPPYKLTHLNDATLSQVAMQPLEAFWFPGAKGDKVEGFLVKPPNFDASKKYPVKFLIHGGPQGAWGDDWSYRWNPELFAANGYVVVMINFHGSTGYGQKFIDAINGNWGGAPFEDLMKGLDYAEKTYPFIDKDRECALGASYGGYMANWVLGHTDRFKCIVSHDGMFNTESAWGTTEELWFNNWEFKGTPYSNPAMYEKWSPRNSASNFKTPTLVVHGQLDYRLDVSEGFQLFDTLQVMGVPSKMLYFPDEGHWVLKPQNAQLWYKTVNDWVDRWTKGAPQ
jgi:dipeptidyl aminopeptidase/acylaminoacyl peptidase